LFLLAVELSRWQA